MIQTTVGKSDRTPCKHQLMDKIFGREMGALSRPSFAGVPGAFWVDLTAGDGIAYSDDGPWHKNCSPGILAHHARFPLNRKPVQVELFEKAPRSYADLLDNLERELPELTYVRTGDSQWHARDGLTSFTVTNADSATFDLSRIPSKWAVQVVNDPNSINTWAMDPRLMGAIKERTKLCLGMSTMGCNVSGTKRLDREDREGWYQHVQAQIDGLHDHHDLLLSAIDRDASQWAYLVTAPEVWKAKVTDDANGAFNKGGFTLSCAWLRDDIVKFRDLLDRLFLTSVERRTA